MDSSFAPFVVELIPSSFIIHFFCIIGCLLYFRLYKRIVLHIQFYVILEYLFWRYEKTYYGIIIKFISNNI